MKSTIKLSGEEAAQIIAAVMEYNGFDMTSMRVFGKALGSSDARAELHLEEVEVTCGDLTLKVRSVPEDGQDPYEKALRALEAQRAQMAARLAGVGLTQGIPDGGPASPPGPAEPAPAAPTPVSPA